MRIGGLMKLTLLDYPGKVACTVFLECCNFRCPFCHNSYMADGCSSDRISEEEFFAFLEKRRGVLDGVCVSGGEPLLNENIDEFLKKIKDMGFAVKLDTNGSFPERLKRVVDGGLCDHVAMDIKNVPEKYAETTGKAQIDIEKILESIEFLKKSGVSHEFRTTVVKDFHTASDLREIGRLVGENESFFIQPFLDSESVYQQGLQGFDEAEVAELLAAAREFAPKTAVRGMDL